MHVDPQTRAVVDLIMLLSAVMNDPNVWTTQGCLRPAEVPLVSKCNRRAVLPPLWVEDFASWQQSLLSLNQSEWECVCTISAAYNQQMPSEAVQHLPLSESSSGELVLCPT